jgi:hypothetical protein
MVHVYLDQNKWIDLSRALAGDELGAPFREVAAEISAAVGAGSASFPLSAAHVFELWKKRRAEPREQLASTMSAISRNDAIAPPWVLLPAELDRAFQSRFSRPETMLPLEPFGRGMRHRGGASAPGLPTELRDYLRAQNPGVNDDELADWMDAVLLVGPAEDLPTADIPQPPLEFAKNFADGENAQVQLFTEHDAGKGTRRNVVSARVLLDIKEPIDDALARAGLTWDALISLEADGLNEFMLDLPSRAAGLELMWLQHDNTETRWWPNDMNDIGYLSAAVAYCDVVVTERKWTAMLKRCGAPERFGTIVLSDLSGLAELLAAPSPAR